MTNLEQNLKLLRIVTKTMNELLTLEPDDLSKQFLGDLCDIVRSLENKIHLAKLDIAIDEGDFEAIDNEREALKLWKLKER